MKQLLLLMLFLIGGCFSAQHAFAQKVKTAADTTKKKRVGTEYCSKQIINYSGYYFDIYVDNVLRKEMAAYAKIQLTLADHAQVKFVSKGKTIQRLVEVFCADTKPLYPVGTGEEEQP